MAECKRLIGAKKELRDRYLAYRNALTETEIIERSERIIERLISLYVYKEADIILLYLDYGSEVRTAGLAESILLQKDKRVFVPKVVGDDIDFFEITGLGEVEPGYRGIREPVADGGGVLKDFRGIDLDRCLALVPGVVFDRDCGRIGYGGGFYDRFLHKYRGLFAVALGYDCQIAPQVPVGTFDVKVNMIVTEGEVIY